jgi:uncharacterized membrane protein YedE/YeeE
MNEVNPASVGLVVVWGAFALALVFGYVGARTNFCAMGAVSDIVNMGDWTRMRMWMLAIAVAILGASALSLSGQVDLGKSIYTSPNVTWLSFLVGGFLFGAGMVLASGCGSKTLIRIGGGNLKSLVVLLVLAVSAYMTLKGLFGMFRVGVLEPVAIALSGSQDLPSIIARATGADKKAVMGVLSLAFSGGLLLFVFKDREFRSFDNILGGVVVGLVVVGGWYLSGHVGYLAEDPQTLEEKFLATNSGRMESLSFVSPQAYLLELLMLWSDKTRVVTFGIASVLGMAAGSWIYALTSRTFRLESFRDAEDTVNHLVGGVFMGFGGVVALGCTVGQGLSGISTLAVGSFIALFAIIAGAVAALKFQYWKMLRED